MVPYGPLIVSIRTKRLPVWCSTHVVVAVGVMVRSPLRGLLILLHLSVTFLRMALATVVLIQKSRWGTPAGAEGGLAVAGSNVELTG